MINVKLLKKTYECGFERLINEKYAKKLIFENVKKVIARCR